MTNDETGLPANVSAALVSAGLDPDWVVEIVDRALAEDLAGGVDVTTVATVPADQQSVLDLVAKGEGVIAGTPLAAIVFHRASRGLARSTFVADGTRVVPGDLVGSVSGSSRDLLLGERTALNLLCHLSGIATLTRQWVDAVAGGSTKVRDSRKTTPGMRALEKYAVRCGGGVNHRMSLSDEALIKDNHVVAAGGVAAAYEAIRREFPAIRVEVEVDTMDQLDEAIAAGAELIMIDNFAPDQMAEAVRRTAGRAQLEASGGLTLANAREVAATGVDFVAVGALTHSAPVLDISGDLRDAS